MSSWLAASGPRELQTVMVTTKTSQSIKGALLERSREALILRAAALAQADQQGNIKWFPLDGDTVIPIANVDFFQTGIDAVMLDGIADAAERRAT